MSTAQPQRLHAYEGHLIDATRWDRFVAREDDIFICTPPKCGTTWTQAIVALLIFARPELEVKPGHISPWIDANFTPLDEILAMLEAEDHRRFVKTHTPLDGIPFHRGCVHLAVYRDPHDAFFSSRAHAENMDGMNAAERLKLGANEAFRAWCEAPLVPGSVREASLARHVHHYRTFKDFEHLDEIHLLHYADMKRDLEGAMRRIARILGIEVAGPLLAELAAAAGFENMKRNAAQFVPDPGRLAWKRDENFFAKGANAQWREVLTVTDLALYEARLAELLPADEAAWLQDGDGETGETG